ncbi:MAG: LETM1 domain-containing protein [SAR324 cluster bacterium]|nr:LETM1 domain-containing protein [SAR324 cluster bacterium]
MNFNRSGWFKKYIEFRAENPLPAALPSAGIRVVDDPSVHNDLEQAIYYFLQPTGLLYGSLMDSPFPSVEYPKGRYFDSLDRVFIVFLESLFACLVADRHFLLDELVDEQDRFTSGLGVAISYFLKNPALLEEQPSYWLNSSYFSRNGRKQIKRFERELSRRITRGSILIYRPELFYNSFLFLDLYGCLLWQRIILVESDALQEELHTLERQETEWREALIKLLIAAGISDGSIPPIERRLIIHFLNSSNLPRKKRKELERLLDAKLPMAEVELPEMPWIIRRFFLEMVLMTVMVDKDFSEGEQVFVARLVEKLGLWEEEMTQSLAVLELFLIGNEDNFHYLKSNALLTGMQRRFMERAGLLVRKNLDSIVNEIKETQELYQLLMKATKTPLNAEEKKKVQEQLSDILKTIPALAIFALPGGGIILPVMLKLLPFNLLPSSFED